MITSDARDGSDVEAVALDEQEALDATLRTLTSRLLAERTPDGHWEGHLASSALATATAVGALVVVDAERHAAVVCAGVDWLVAHQNADGGWGDTVQSASNISTTALAWAACAMAARSTPVRAASPATLDRACADAIARAERWLRAAAGDAPASGTPAAVAAEGAAVAAASIAPSPHEALSSDALVAAIVRRYGKDRTFSVPILTVLAIAGKLGDAATAWRRVPQLPFELAACPHRWFQWLRLPVVSYALPALIAIGQVRHHHRPTRNPVTRLVRRLTRARTLRTLRAIQPASGGYLEAIPLTAFVVMSLAASDRRRDPVVDDGVRFLLDARRADGSWPIDSNLATWVTTLSINALSINALSIDALAQQHAETRETALGAPPPLPLDRPALVAWLLSQQYRVEHPYTHAAPGGWAWTDLSGGVPDADDTPGALLALAHLSGEPAGAAGAPATGPSPADERDMRDVRRAWPHSEDIVSAASAGVRWLLDLQNRDGGVPTFCRGWGALPFDRSSPDLTAHALLAWDAWQDALPQDLVARLPHAIDRASAFLARAQRPDGAWVPLWFGNERAPGEENPTYGTARVLIALGSLALGSLGRGPRARLAAREALVARGVAWLLAAQNADGGWGGSHAVASSIEETALAVDALAAAILSRRSLSTAAASTAAPGTAASGTAASDPAAPEAVALARGVAWLCRATRRGTHTPASPIGLYFAKLWYHERLYPLIFATAALGRTREALKASNG